MKKAKGKAAAAVVEGQKEMAKSVIAMPTPEEIEKFGK